MNLSTKYLGLSLKNPLVPSSSPMMENLDNIRRMEDAGASAVVLHSLFEEQVTDEALKLHYHTTQGTDSFAESLSFFPEPNEYKFGADEYIEHVRKVKDAVSIPVIGSLNGVTAGGWIDYARRMQSAGADAIELNLYNVATDPLVQGSDLEKAYLDLARAVKGEVSLPVAVKLSPFFTSISNLAKSLEAIGIEGLVLFNRFYQPDIDIKNLQTSSKIILSDSNSNRLPMRWIGILYGRINLSLAATTGIHSATDVIKLLMVGADVTMMASALLKNGIDHLKGVISDLENWMEKHEYESITQMKGSMSQKSIPNPAAYERALYLKELHSY